MYMQHIDMYTYVNTLDSAPCTSQAATTAATVPATGATGTSSRAEEAHGYYSRPATETGTAEGVCVCESLCVIV